MSRPGMSRRINRRGLIYSASAPAFSPASLSGLILWLRSDMGITLAGSKVSAWADQSGNGNHFTQGTDAWRPIYTASNANLGNKPSLDFSATTIGLQLTNFAVGLTNISSSVFYRKTIAAGAPRVFGPPTASGGSFNLICNSGANSFDAALINVGPNITRVSPDNINTNYSRTAVLNIGSAATVDGIVYTNGIAGGTIASDTANNGAIPATTWNIGYIFDGSIVEVIAYNRLLTASEALQLANYQIARYT